MKKRKLLSLEDLHEFFAKQNQDVKFSAKDSDKTIVVQINEPFKFEMDEYDPDEYKAKIHTKLCHTKKNVNGSSIDDAAMEEAKASAINMPILGYIWQDEESGEYYFAGHEMYENEDGETVYEEIPIGVITDNLELVYDKEADVNRLEADGYIWKDYTKAYDILKRDKSLWNSVELAIDELSFNSKTNTLIINKFHFTGVTILGKDPETFKDIGPGMKGSNITIADFSADNNSNISEELLEEIKKFNKNFEAFNKDSKKGEDQVTKFEELLTKYGITESEVKFDYADLSDEELEAKFAEVFGDADTGNTDDGDNSDNGDNSDDGNTDGNAGENGSEGETGEGSSEGTDGEGESNSDEGTDTDGNFALTFSDGNKNFSLSYNEIQQGLYNLFNSIHADDDNWFFLRDVYDDNTAIFQNWFDSKYYRQKFEVNNEEVSFVDDAEEVFARFVNEAEKTALDMLQSNYDEAAKELESYHAKETEEKINEILTSEVYSDISEDETFKDLVDNHAEFSVEDVQKKADEILLNYVKSTRIKDDEDNSKATFSVKETTDVKKTKKRSRYGGLFSTADK